MKKSIEIHEKLIWKLLLAVRGWTKSPTTTHIIRLSCPCFQMLGAANIATVQGGVSQELLEATSHIEGPSICIAVAKMCNVIWF